MTLFPAAPPQERSTRGQLVGQVLILAAVLATLLLAISPSPYVVERPGPVYDTLGTTDVDGDEVPVIDISGAETYPTDGRLDLLTVYLDGSPDHPLDWFDVIAAWFDPRKAVLPVESVFPAGQTQEESDAQSALDMQQSQQTATAAALTELGIDFDSVVTVGAVSEGAPADGVLEEGDELLTVGGTAVSTDAGLRAAVQAGGVGEPLELGIRRDGVEQAVTLVPVERSAGDPTPIIGVVPAIEYDFPFDVDIRLQDVGGPSAGMMFALAIADKLTPGAITGGEHVAGTGTIAADGAVGAIGGIRQKMIGARDAGADWFLAPEANCDAVVGHIPDGLTVFAVSTLAEATDVVTAIGDGASTAGFAGCSP
ncbi:YlbL family protein [Protaetiibacter intestinalis]|uniref:YlbL family protein n=1 Tax=Protaetiibacter intestinalis TaxID=2419774 RepID=UPI001D056B59|nr:S16 family serine protease [Protaetiibacter intestinalis]